MKKVAILLSLIVFCVAQNSTSAKTNIASNWNLSALKGTYERKVVTGSGIGHSADSYKLVATWDDVAGFAAVTGGDHASLTDLTNQVMAAWVAGMDAPGFPLTSTFDAATLAASGIAMKGVFDYAPSNDRTGTYKITGSYPSIRLYPETCTPYLTVSQINDSGDYTLTLDATGAAGTMAFAPATILEQVLPPFPDGKFTVDANAGKMTIDFLDRDNSSSRYSEVMAAWNEADDRVISGISQLPVNTLGGFFTTADDPSAGDLASSAYISQGSLAAWGYYLTWYAFNVAAETSLKASDGLNPLTDLDGDGSITLADMIIYMHADNLAGGGSVSAFGIPYAMLVDSSNPAAPAAVNDSATDFSLAGIGTFSGGKMKFTILNGLCMPVDETINIAFEFSKDYLSTEGEGVPVQFALHENYPNPFNPTTTLRFDLPEVSNLTLTIYNMLGQKVRTFNYQNTSAGYHSVKWNATNDYGDPVGAGVYLYQLQTKDFVKTRKMVLLK
jgi:hypothetical protein